ncbi:hypothetical protein LOTGIDRAFT_159585 [Lottia gigantea]|uniref:Uncharacterized protein n=1 Tax=Lottia gigantea TaxID=225164 RepID=V4AT06_LOTGI|nr:hypothetical protein LOTGIDRAFT_159585 [Lottia gigantea]ESO96841.1 hypothetical protein LOTGIDRAFT_159585 [Lottia gigantea]
MATFHSNLSLKMAHLARRPNQVILTQIQTIKTSATTRTSKTRHHRESSSDKTVEKPVPEKSSKKPAQVQPAQPPAPRERKRRSDINDVSRQSISPGKKVKSENVKEPNSPRNINTNSKELKVEVEDIGLCKSNNSSSKDKTLKTRRNPNGAKTNNSDNKNHSPSPVVAKDKKPPVESSAKVKVSAKSKLSTGTASENRKCKSDKSKAANKSNDVCGTSVSTTADKNLRTPKQLPVDNDSSDVKESIDENKTNNTNSDSVTLTSSSSNIDKVTDSNISSDSEDMHFKKQLLLTSGTNNNKSENSSNVSGSITSNIDVNLSVIDQVTKLAKAEKLALNGDGKSDSESSVSVSQTSVSVTSREQSEKVEIKTQEIKIERSRESNIGFQAYVSRSNPTTPAMDERSDSRASDERSTSSVHHEKRPSSQYDDLKKRSPASSPLVIDRHDPVLPYRDPELMKQNPVHFLGGMMGHPKTLSQSSSYQTVHNPIPATPSALPTSTSYSSHQITRPLLTSLPNHYPIPPQSLGAITRPLSLPPGYSQLDALTAHAQHQQLAAMQFQNAAHLMHLPYAPLSGNHRLHQLEILWQQKFPSIPVPPSWLLVKHQDELLSEVTSLHHRELERERLDREQRERERMELERERMEAVERERRKER